MIIVLKLKLPLPNLIKNNLDESGEEEEKYQAAPETPRIESEVDSEEENEDQF